jgi:phosphoglycerol transferase MdoB-like AlkP superfamily enzyme
LAVVDQPASRLSGEIPDDLVPIARELELFFRPPIQKELRKRFDRVVLLGIESLSLEFTGYKEPPCSVSITPNLDRLMREYPSGALLTNATPSIESLTSIFVSHPNSREARLQGFPNSFVRRLQSHGFRTLAVRPAYEKFDNEHIHYRRAGFDALLGSEFFKSQAEYASYVSGWGLEDAKIYQFAADLLEENLGRKLFFLLTTADTHGPFGREAYSMTYPDLPSNISCSLSNERLLRAVFRADHDLGRFVEEVKRRGLLDERTLLIVTADHSSPAFYEPAPPALAHVPVVFISKNREVELAGLTDHSSLYDLGPTILSLAGLEPARGYFGRDLSGSTSSNYFGKHGNRIYWQNAAGKGSIDVDLPMDQRERDIINLTNFFLLSD